MNTRLLFIHALSPLHAGTGQGVGIIDLPIAREKATGLPYLPGSSVKGTLRDTDSNKIDSDLRKKVFGPETTEDNAHAGSVQFSDQRLLLLPVRSLVGTFAWVTSPYVLRRLLRDAQSAGVSDVPQEIPMPQAVENCFIVANSSLARNNKVILEDLDLQIVSSDQENTKAWATWIGQQLFATDSDVSWQQILCEHFCLVHDDTLSFLLDTATEVTARIKLLVDTKTVEKGGLWYEEALPSESILSGLVVATPARKFEKELGISRIFELLSSLMSKPAQFGGKATVGRGLCRMQMVGGQNDANT